MEFLTFFIAVLVIILLIEIIYFLPITVTLFFQLATVLIKRLNEITAMLHDSRGKDS